MNNDIINGLSRGEHGDMSSNCTFISSLEEHSYCASIMEANDDGNIQGEVIGDLFAINVSPADLSNDMDPPAMQLTTGMGDVNLDGFNYSVPSVPASGNGGSMELENMWGGLSSDTNTAVVEVAASCEEREQHSVDVVVLNQIEPSSTIASISDANYCGTKSNQSENTMRTLKSKPRRTDFIWDHVKRKNHFQSYFEKLTEDFQRIMGRTGCKGTLAASFEGKSYDSRLNEPNIVLTPTFNRNISNLSHQSTSTTPANHESLLDRMMDDHRYAATMLTQTVLSSAVRDHQYDEITITSALDSDTTDDNGDAKYSKGKIMRRRKNSKRYRYDFIKVRWERTQVFAKVIKSLFTSKILLEQRTGADIQISVDYEGLTFNEQNFKTAFNIISAHGKKMKSKRFNVLPAQVLSPKSFESSAPPVTFILPNFTPFPFQVPCIFPNHESSEVPCENLPVSAPVSQTSPNFHTTRNTADVDDILESFHADNEDDNRIDSANNNPSLEHEPVSSRILGSTLNKITLEERGVIIKSNSRSPTADVSDANFSPVETVHDVSERMLFDNSSSQHSPEAAIIARGMKESASNTEPICSICSSETLSSSNSSGEHVSKKLFWIRCNDPFCYEMVHASCVGFVVTHSAHLKQLPAYYCKFHR